MSRRNRQKRAAKHKDRRRASSHQKRWSTDPGYDRVALLDRLTAALYNSALCPYHDAEFHAAELLGDFPGLRHELDLAAEGTVAGAISSAWQAGWSPNDLHEFARRRLDAAAAGYLAEAVVRESRHYPVTSLHPRWRAEIDALPAEIDHAAPQMWEWADTNAVDHQAALTVVLKVLRLLGTLPILEPLLPLPGAHQHSAVVMNPADAKALSRVRGLLAKAEATKFPEEAEALSAKAQELMSRYSLQHAIRDHEQGRAAEATARRIWIDSPYVIAKAALVQALQRPISVKWCARRSSDASPSSVPNAIWNSLSCLRLHYWFKPTGRCWLRAADPATDARGPALFVNHFCSRTPSASANGSAPPRRRWPQK